MEKQNRVFSTKSALCLALLLLLGCAVLFGGITYARYQWEFTQASYFFTPENRIALTVYGEHLSEQVVHSGNLPATSGAWKAAEGGAQLDFSVANGKPDAFWQEDQQFAIRLAVGLTAEQAENLTVTLSYTDDNGDPVTVVAEPTAIAAGSFLHSSFGDGWIYEFTTQQSQLRFDLQGSAFDYRNFTITVTGSVPATLLDLQVTQMPAA